MKQFWQMDLFFWRKKKKTLNHSKTNPLLISVLVLLMGILLCIPAIQPILKHGLFPVHDDTQVVRVYEMYKSLQGGMFPVRWVPDLGYGYGYPIFNFYAPLAYYVGGIFMLAGFNVISATQFMFVFGALLSFVSMYLFMRSMLGHMSGLVAGVIYMYFPYHAVNIYVRGAVGEFYAYAFLPIVFWGLFELFELFQEKDMKFLHSIRWIVVSSLGICFVAISHNLTLFMLGLLLIPYFLVACAFSKQKKNLATSYALAVILGGMLAAFYILPAAFESHFTNVTSQVGGGADYPDHFVCLRQLYESAWGFGGSVKGCTDGLSFKIGKINILLFMVSMILFSLSILKKRKESFKELEIVTYLLFGLSILLLLPVSKLMWDIIPGMEFLQYPWRFLNFVGLFLSIIVGFFVFRLKGYYILAPFIAGVVIVGLTLFFNIKLFIPQSFQTKTVSEYIYQPDIRFRVSKISDEYMPKGFQKPTHEDEVNMGTFVIDGQGKVDSFHRTITDIKSKISIESPSTIHYFLAYFPTWNFYVNGKKVDPLIKRNGVFIQLQSGNYTLEARYQQTVIEKIGDSISLIGIFIVFAVIIGFVGKNHGQKTS
jgi:hypothetical protein